MSRIATFIMMLLLSSFSWSQGIVVSTQPIYLIAKEVTKGVETPTLLLADQSGHDVQLSPMHRKLVQDASLVIWLGKQHEAPLAKLLSGQPKAISILASDLVQTLPQRTTRGMAQPNTIDTHVWLEPNNAIRIGYFIAALRSQQYPENKAQYWANAKRFASEMHVAAHQQSHNARAKPYWAYHDAYQYLERALGLKFSGALTDEPHIAPTMAQIKYLNDSRPRPKMCLLAEVHASSSQYQKVSPITFQAVDETMSGGGSFVEEWRLLANNIQKCVDSVQ